MKPTSYTTNNKSLFPLGINNHLVNVPPQFQKILQQIGITNPEIISTRQAAAYLSHIKSLPTAPSSLEVYRCQSRGPKYKKIGSRVFYTVAWLDEWAMGVEVKIFDPSKN